MGCAPLDRKRKDALLCGGDRLSGTAHSSEGLEVTANNNSGRGGEKGGVRAKQGLQTLSTKHRVCAHTCVCTHMYTHVHIRAHMHTHAYAHTRAQLTRVIQRVEWPCAPEKAGRRCGTARRLPCTFSAASETGARARHMPLWCRP